MSKVNLVQLIVNTFFKRQTAEFSQNSPGSQLLFQIESISRNRDCITDVSIIPNEFYCMASIVT